MPKLRRISKTASVRCLVTGEASHGGLYKARWKVRLKVRKLSAPQKAESLSANSHTPSAPQCISGLLERSHYFGGDFTRKRQGYLACRQW